MKRISLLIFILIYTVMFTLAGCSGKQGGDGGFSVPEAEKIQKLLDDLSAALLEKDMDAVDGIFAEGCPRRGSVLDNLSLLMASELSDYSQAVTGAKRLRDGVVCTVSISVKGSRDGKSLDSRSVRSMYFIFQEGSWKIGDYDYYPYISPTVVVGSESVLYDAASRMSEELGSKLRTDTEHLQSYGDIILVGTPYDNASILDLEEKGLTAVKVTDDYPESGLGIVQVLSNVENYRHVIIIQGSGIKTAEDSIGFMTRYLKTNPYLNPGVYFVEENSLRKADPLELTTLVILDMDKASQRLNEVQKHMEANIQVVLEELTAEKEQLLREQKHSGNPYREDYSRAFSRYGFYPEQSPYDSMVLINANLTDSRLCTSAFGLPYGNNGGTAYAYNDFVNRTISLDFNEGGDDRGPLLRNNTGHVRTAHEINASANELEIACFGTALMRLSGFSSREVYSITTASGNAVFFNIEGGYAASPAVRTILTPEMHFPVGKLISVYNDGAFISYEDNSSNLDAAEVSAIYAKAEGLFRLSGRQPGKAPEKVPFRKSELAEPLGAPYDTEDIYDLLRNAFVIDEGPCLYSTLDEAREQLRSAMGRLLAVKCTRYIVNTASRYPASQFDYARYAAGLIDVEHPGVYAEAADSSRMLESMSGGFSGLLSDIPEKMQVITGSLSEIAEEEVYPDMFFFPDYCIVNKTGSHRDKALLAFGLYVRLMGSTEDVWIALGEDNSYLAFKEEDRWRYLDCKYNVTRDYMNDKIYIAFNRDSVYNERLGIGDAPEFIK